MPPLSALAQGLPPRRGGGRGAAPSPAAARAGDELWPHTPVGDLQPAADAAQETAGAGYDDYRKEFDARHPAHRPLPDPKRRMRTGLEDVPCDGNSDVAKRVGLNREAAGWLRTRIVGAGPAAPLVLPGCSRRPPLAGGALSPPPPASSPLAPSPSARPGTAPHGARLLRTTPPRPLPMSPSARSAAAAAAAGRPGSAAASPDAGTRESPLPPPFFGAARLMAELQAEVQMLGARNEWQAVTLQKREFWKPHVAETATKFNDKAVLKKFWAKMERLRLKAARARWTGRVCGVLHRGTGSLLRRRYYLKWAGFLAIRRKRAVAARRVVAVRERGLRQSALRRLARAATWARQRRAADVLLLGSRRLTRILRWKAWVQLVADARTRRGLQRHAAEQLLRRTELALLHRVLRRLVAGPVELRRGRQNHIRAEGCLRAQQRGTQRRDFNRLRMWQLYGRRRLQDARMAMSLEHARERERLLLEARDGLRRVAADEPRLRVGIVTAEAKGSRQLAHMLRQLTMPFGKTGSVGMTVRSVYPSQNRAVVLKNVQPGGAAEEAGLESGDAILWVENPIGTQYISDRNQFLVQIGPRGHVFEGTSVSVGVLRGDDAAGLDAHLSAGHRAQEYAPEHGWVRTRTLCVGPISDGARANRLRYLEDAKRPVFGPSFNSGAAYALVHDPDTCRRNFRTALAEYDGDRSGSLRLDELVGVGKGIAGLVGVPAPSDARLWELFGDADVDESGELDFEELFLHLRQLFIDIIYDNQGDEKDQAATRIQAVHRGSSTRKMKRKDTRMRSKTASSTVRARTGTTSPSYPTSPSYATSPRSPSGI